MAKLLHDIEHDINARGNLEEGIFEEIRLLTELNMAASTDKKFSLDIPPAEKSASVMPGDIVMVDAGEGARRAYVVTKGGSSGKVEITWVRSGKKHPAPIDVADLKHATASQYTRGQMLAKGNPGAVVEPSVGESKANIYNYTKQFSFMTI